MREEIIAAAHTLTAYGLVTAFGHVSARTDGSSSFIVTPPKPLGSLAEDESLTEVSLFDNGLPEGVPGEVWIHQAIYEQRPDVKAICRGQPETATALAAAGVRIKALHGQGAFLGREVPVLDDARLIRTRELGEAVAVCLGDENGIVLRGNGALTVGENIGEAVARMWVLEASARLNWQASAAGKPQTLDEEEFSYWEAVSGEILTRIWNYMKSS